MAIEPTDDGPIHEMIGLAIRDLETSALTLVVQVGRTRAAHGRSQ
jgi:hypothetical protein